MLLESINSYTLIDKNVIILIIYTIIWIITLFILKNNNINNSKNDKDSLEQLKDIKEMLDLKIISEDEYNELKEVILEREYGKWKK